MYTFVLAQFLLTLYFDTEMWIKIFVVNVSKMYSIVAAVEGVHGNFCFWVTLGMGSRIQKLGPLF